ncbi:thiamine phosphate synthase [Gaetbulibacter saemankumensis]|uniref:thiamine phosphate synthase n=1 Tax=Gaetbulibacter saemankumensis TaxID=311208 RepID=UPI0004211E62|nr:thiamine phosphate synthase [Gaetbulibacter saemankumensis]
MIVLIAPEQDITNEFEILHQLFQVGLEYYHLRKPHKDLNSYKAYLNEIDPYYHNRIVIHQYHNLANDFNLKGLHFQELKRQETSIETRNDIRNTSHMSISSSFHSVEELTQCEFLFDYHLLSPVFSSISKAGYHGKEFNVNGIPKNIIGMGGVTTKNLNEFDALGYQGVGVLGGIWSSKTPIKDFKYILNHYSNN